MQIVFFMLMVLLLFVFGYAQQQRGICRTPGTITLNQEEEIQIQR